MGNVNASQWMDATRQEEAGSSESPVCCPLCGATENKALVESARRSLRKCAGCGVAFVFPPPPRTAVVSRFQDEGAPHFDPEHNREAVLKRIATCIHKYRDSGMILDVGCATGYFLSQFFPPEKWRRVGFELLESSARKAESRGLTVSRGDVRHTGLKNDSVDLVTVLEAFYYFLEPQFELAEFRRILKDDGLLVLEMPVATSRILRLSRIAGERVRGVSGSLFGESDHLYYHTPLSLSRLLANNGFRVVDVVMLPPNRQNQWSRELLYRAYWLFSRTLRIFSGGHIFLGPRFLVAAQKRTSPAELTHSAKP